MYIGESFCVALTYIVLSVGFIFFVCQLGFVWAQSNPLIYWPTIDIAARIFMAAICHLFCVVSDPGYASKGSADDSKKVCKKCSSIRIENTHHCSSCNHCVEQMDHHCPWIANCVGINTQRAFLLFLFYAASAAIEALVLVGVRLSTCGSTAFAVLGLRVILGSDRVDELLAAEEDVLIQPTCDFTIAFAVLGTVASISALVFAIFISFIAVDQLQNIVNNQSTIQLLKGEQGPKRTLQQAALDVMGAPPSLWWLCPRRPRKEKSI